MNDPIVIFIDCSGLFIFILSGENQQK